MFPGWVSEVFVIVGLIVLAISFFRAQPTWVRKIGMWIVFATIGVAIWFLTDQWILVIFGLAAWFVIPVSQAAVMSRKLRFSVERKLTPGPLDLEEFPEIHPISAELQDLGFARHADLWLKPSPLDQGFRVFVHEDDKISVALAIVRQGGVSLSYLIFASVDKDGTYWITWDYPLAYGLKMPKHFRIYRCLDAELVSELFGQHREFLRINEVDLTKTKSSATTHFDVHEMFDQLFRDTLNYNLKVGLLQKVEGADKNIRYSWRGTCFIVWQVFLEVVRG